MPWFEKASYLNGKIGDIRSYNMEDDRYGVYFEDTNLDLSKAQVKPQNLRILFNLPKQSL